MDQHRVQHFPVFPPPSASKGILEKSNDWRWELDSLWEHYTHCLLDPTWIRAANCGEARPAPSQDSPLLLVGFRRDAILRIAATVTGSTYTHQLENLVKVSRENRSGRANVHLLHINAWSHLGKENQNKLETLGWETVSYPFYSPDLAPSNYHLFRNLKKFLAEKFFNNYDALKNGISNFFGLQPSNFWAKDINDLFICWASVVDNSGNYIID